MKRYSVNCTAIVAAGDDLVEDHHGSWTTVEEADRDIELWKQRSRSAETELAGLKEKNREMARALARAEANQMTPDDKRVLASLLEWLTNTESALDVIGMCDGWREPERARLLEARAAEAKAKK